MTTDVISLGAVRAEKSARTRAEIEAFCTALREWHSLSVETRGALADDLAGEITRRYAPIGKQLSAGLYDALVLHMAGAAERGTDPVDAVFLALALLTGDMRHVHLAAYIDRERKAVQMGPIAALEFRRSLPSPVDDACSRLVDHYIGLRKS